MGNIKNSLRIGSKIANRLKIEIYISDSLNIVSNFLADLSQYFITIGDII